LQLILVNNEVASPSFENFAFVPIKKQPKNTHMQKLIYSLLLFLSLKGLAQFTPGNLVIYRVGDGTAALTNTGTAVFLDEYTPAGTFVRSIPMPTQASGSNKPLIASGTALTEGYLNRSADKQYLTLTGYAQALGDPNKIATTTASAVNRVIGIVDYAGNINTTTALSDYSSGGSPRSAVTDNGSNLWMTGTSGGVRYTTVGATTSKPVSTAIDNLRIISIFNNQLYTSIGTTTATRVGTVGTGLPTTGGQPINNLPGLSNVGSPFQYVLFDQSPAIPGLDVLYIADEDSAVFKYSLDASNQWVSNGAIGTRFDYYRGLTGVSVGGVVTLYAIRKGGTIKSGSGGELVALTDASGHNGTFAPVPVILATAATNTGWRGIAFAPEPLGANIILPVRFDNVKATQTNSGIEISFSNKAESNVVNYTIERSVNARNFEAAATINPVHNTGSQADYAWLDKAHIADILYYRIKGVETSGKVLYSPIVKISKTLSSELRIFPNPVQGNQLTWEAGLPKGIYKIQVINDAGQIVLMQTLSHSGGNISQTIHLPATIKRGRYNLQFSGEGVQMIKPFVVL
jgi:hypothetical protein